ncbi:MAG: ADP compounds hydrolase NudE [Legionellales bacterium]|jgi:ADP-ribose diphosphatase
MTKKPEILKLTKLAQTKVFGVEGMKLRFSNGQERDFERLQLHHGAVLVIPQPEPGMVWLAREYAAGVDRYELGFPKGLIDEGEEMLAAANRELQEELGYGARKLTHLKTVTLAPGYMGHLTHIILASDLYPSKLPGDEPEPIEIVPWHLDQTEALLARDDFTDSRSIAAILMITNERYKR